MWQRYWLSFGLVFSLMFMGNFGQGARAEEGASYWLRIVSSKVFEVPEQVVLSNGQNFRLDIMLDSVGQPVEAANVIVRYDPEYVQAIDGQGQPSNRAIPGEVFDQYPESGNRVEDGLIRVTGYDSQGESRSGLFASVWFRPLQTTGVQAQLFFNIDFLDGETRDSNIAQSGRDILRETRNMSFSIVEATQNQPNFGIMMSKVGGGWWEYQWYWVGGALVLFLGWLLLSSVLVNKP